MTPLNTNKQEKSGHRKIRARRVGFGLDENWFELVQSALPSWEPCPALPLPATGWEGAVPLPGAGRGSCLLLSVLFSYFFFSYCCAFCAVFIFLLSLCILAACAVEVGLACRISACVSCSSSGILTSLCIPSCEMGTMVVFALNDISKCMGCRNQKCCIAPAAIVHLSDLHAQMKWCFKTNVLWLERIVTCPGKLLAGGGRARGCWAARSRSRGHPLPGQSHAAAPGSQQQVSAC